MKTHSAIMAAVLGAALATPALAETQTVGVRYADLDLATPAGQAELDRRIDRVARSICKMDEVITGSRTPSSAARQCYQEAKASTHQQIADRRARAAGAGGG